MQNNHTRTSLQLYQHQSNQETHSGQYSHARSPYTSDKKQQQSDLITIDFANKLVSNLHNSLILVLGQQNLNVTGPSRLPLIELVLNDNQLVNLEGMGRVANRLIKMKAHNNALRNVKGIQNHNYPHLQQIYLEFNQINSISGLQDSTYPKLIRLTLSSNELTSENVAQVLPFLIAPQLRILGLDNNQLTSLQFLQKLKLQYLINLPLANNRIVTFQPLMKCNFLSKLCNLELQGNLITNIPPFGADMCNLRKLILSKNLITTAEGLISCQFPKLQVLQLQNNLLSNVHFLYRFQAPKIIDIKLLKNKIIEIPRYSLRHGLYPVLQQIILKNNQVSGDVISNLITSFSDTKEQRQHFHFSFSEIGIPANGKKLISRQAELKLFDSMVPYNTNKNFRMFGCWRNRLMIKDHRIVYARMKKHFQALSYLQL